VSSPAGSQAHAQVACGHATAELIFVRGLHPDPISFPSNFRQ
jgi:hypothetical protein